MNYLILIYESEHGVAARTDEARAPEYWQSWSNYADALIASGIFVDGNGLQPATTATTVRLRDDKRLVHDGPFADTKEQLGGYFVVNVPDLDTALEWAARCPAATDGAVEVRPALPPRD